MLIGVGYFTKGDRRIANASEGQSIGQDSQAVKSKVEGYIEQYEPVYLRKALGADIADEIESHQTIPEHLQSLVDRIKEPLAEFVFFHIARDSNNVTTINGIVQLENAGNTVIPPLRVMVRSWNRMVDMHKRLCGWLEEQPYSVTIDAELLTPINIFNI